MKNIDSLSRSSFESWVIGCTILLEPVGRNTAPAVALAALSAGEEDPLLLVLAADHVITDKKRLHDL